MSQDKIRSAVRRVPMTGAALLVMAWSYLAHATVTINVTSTLDDDVGCTLRKAVAAANGTSNACGNGTGLGDTINLPAGTYTLDPNKYGLFLQASMVIQGTTNDNHSSSIDGHGYHIFQLAWSGSPNLNLYNLELKNGWDIDQNGSALSVPAGATATLDNIQVDDCLSWLGGGVYSGGTLNIYSSYFHDNQAAYGGAVYATDNPGTLGTSLMMDTVLFKNNRANQNGTFSDGGALYTTTSAQTALSYCTFGDAPTTGNTALGSGGAIWGGGNLHVDVTSIRYNSATKGGGMDAEWTMNSSNMYMNTSTIANNTASTNGGGLYVTTTAHVTNCTISSNHADSGSGGGAYLTGSVAYLQTQFSTIAFNNASNGGGVYRDQGLTATEGTIVAKNTASSSAPDFSGDPRVDAGQWASIFGDRHGLDTSHLTVGKDQWGTATTPIDPLLATLQWNGYTYSHSLGTNSPAYNKAKKINGTGTNCTGSFAIDQRFFSRPTSCDIGSFEYHP